MLIRSQDKAALINLDNIISLVLDSVIDNGEALVATSEDKADLFSITCETVRSKYSIGQYFTKEKALKVLDMIQTAYESSLYCDHAFDNSAQVQRPYIFANNCVFKIPQDSEV